MRQVLPDPARRLDEVDAVTVMLLHTGGDGKDVRVENNILRWEADAVDQNVVGARANRSLLLKRVGLAKFIERHHHDGRAVAAHQFGVTDEGRFALLERDRVY